MAQYFGFEGRVRPMTFWVNAIVLAIINFIVSYLFVDVYLSWGTGTYQVHISNPPMYYLITFALLWRLTSIAVRRFQDQDNGEGVGRTPGARFPVSSSSRLAIHGNWPVCSPGGGGVRLYRSWIPGISSRRSRRKHIRRGAGGRADVLILHPALFLDL